LNRRPAYLHILVNVSSIKVPWKSRLASLPSVAIRGLKRCINEGGNVSLAEGLKVERQVFQQISGSEDAIEGVASFLEKRKPVFKGR
jgi:enoyl-CoA hydratase/carnithine racemase